MSDIQEQIKLVHKKAEENDIKLLKEELEYEQYCNEQLRNKITNLQEENKDLQERYNLVCKISEERKNKWLSLNEENEDLFSVIKDYKFRNEKAIEFVNEFIQEDYYEKLDEYITHFTWNTTKEDLLNKLQGVDKE